MLVYGVAFNAFDIPPNRNRAGRDMMVTDRYTYRWRNGSFIGSLNLSIPGRLRWFDNTSMGVDMVDT